MFRGSYGKSRISRGAVIQYIIDTLRTQKRWDDAIQILEDEGNLTGTEQDIQLIMDAIRFSITAEEEIFIEKALVKAMMKKIRQHLVIGFPNYYKNKLGINSED